MAESRSELKTWWKQLVVASTGPMVVVLSTQLGWGVAAVVGIVFLVIGVAIFFYDLGSRPTPRAKREVATSPGETKERVLETVVEVDEGEEHELVSYYLEKGDRILVEADSRVHGGRFSLLVLHQSDLSAYKKDEGPYTVVSKDNTPFHRERFDIPESGYWHFIIEPEWGEDVSVELSIWKLY